MRAACQGVEHARWRQLVPPGSIRSFGALRPLRTVRPLDSLYTTPPVQLNGAGMVSTALAMIIRHMVRPIEPSKLAAAVGPTILSAIHPPVFPTILAPVQLLILPPHISALSHPDIIVSGPTMTAIAARSAVERAGPAV